MFCEIKYNFTSNKRNYFTTLLICYEIINNVLCISQYIKIPTNEIHSFHSLILQTSDKVNDLNYTSASEIDLSNLEGITYKT